ncbi:DUF397 domain-containing protein [Streptomyces vinaceus]|uniref:DUF397 domain-containing protein n=1 Tax=Streptomyces vinaceus TaxID=1960 RepID=UPI0038124962
MSIKPSGEGSPAPAWVKSSYGTAGGADRVEAAPTPGTVLAPDSERPGDGRPAVAPTARDGFAAHTSA